MNTTTQTASLKNVKKVFMIATAAEQQRVRPPRQNKQKYT